MTPKLLSDAEIAEIAGRGRKRQLSYDFAKEASGEPLSATGPMYHQDIAALLAHIEASKMQTPLRDDIARLVYLAMPYTGVGEKPTWVPGGNSFMQDAARIAADAILAILPTSKAQTWLPISEFKGPNENVVAFGTWTVDSSGKELRDEWQQFLGFQDDDTYKLLDPENQESLPWDDLEDYTHFMRLPPSPPSSKAAASNSTDPASPKESDT